MSVLEAMQGFDVALLFKSTDLRCNQDDLGLSSPV